MEAGLANLPAVALLQAVRQRMNSSAMTRWEAVLAYYALRDRFRTAGEGASEVECVAAHTIAQLLQRVSDPAPSRVPAWDAGRDLDDIIVRLGLRRWITWLEAGMDPVQPSEVPDAPFRDVRGP